MYRWLGLIACFFLFTAGASNSESQVAIGDVPTAVRTTAVEQANGAEITSIAKEREEGEDAYAAEWVLGAITHGGRGFGKWHLLESEVAVSLDSIPEIAKEVISKSLVNAKEIKVFKKAIMLYKAEGLVDGKEVDILLDANGKNLTRSKDDADDDDDDEGDDDGNDDDDKDEKEITLAECPNAVSKTLNMEASGGKIIEIERSNDKGNTIYEADIEIDGHVYETTIRSDGVLLEKKLDD